MFVLAGNAYPESGEELAEAVAGGLGSVLGLSPDVSPVSVESGEWPRIPALSIRLTDALVDPKGRRRAPVPGAERTAGPRIDRLAIRAEPLRIGDVPVTLGVEAEDVAIEFARDGRDRPLALFRSVGSGTLDIFVTREGLGKAARSLLNSVLSPKGVQVVSVDAQLVGQGDHGFWLELAVTVRKLFKARFRLSGVVEVDDRLTARLPEINVKGEGANGKFLASMIRPQAERYRGTEISLASLAPAGLPVRDVRVDVEDGLRLTAGIGDDAEAS